MSTLSGSSIIDFERPPVKHENCDGKNYKWVKLVWYSYPIVYSLGPGTLTYLALSYLLPRWAAAIAAIAVYYRCMSKIYNYVRLFFVT